MSVESPLPALALAGANSEIDPIRMRVVNLSAMLPSRDPEAMGADENVIAFQRWAEKCLILSEVAI